MVKTAINQTRFWYIRNEPWFGVFCVLVFVIYLTGHKAGAW
jgi:hypothetical protein